MVDITPLVSILRMVNPYAPSRGGGAQVTFAAFFSLRNARSEPQADTAAHAAHHASSLTLKADATAHNALSSLTYARGPTFPSFRSSQCEYHHPGCRLRIQIPEIPVTERLTYTLWFSHSKNTYNTNTRTAEAAKLTSTTLP